MQLASEKSNETTRAAALPTAGFGACVGRECRVDGLAHLLPLAFLDGNKL